MHNYFFYYELYELNELFFNNGFNGLNGFSLMHSAKLCYHNSYNS